MTFEYRGMIRQPAIQHMMRFSGEQNNPGPLKSNIEDTLTSHCVFFAFP